MHKKNLKNELIKNNTIISELEKKDSSLSQYHISLWKRNMGNYDINIFVVLLNDNNQLIESWDGITSSIAVHFQNELEKQVELWNIYIIFIVKKQVDPTIKYKIQQDKYSSRKIVIELNDKKGDEVTDSLINEIVNAKLFDLNFENEMNFKISDQKFTDIETYVHSKDEKLYQVLKYSQNTVQMNLKNLIKIYLGGKNEY